MPQRHAGHDHAPATFRCMSSASRAMNRCMTSVRALEDAVDAQSRITRSTGIGALAARGQRRRGLVAAPAAHLHGVVDELASPRRCSTAWPSRPRGGCRSAPVGQQVAEVGHGLHREGAAAMSEIMCGRSPRAGRWACPTARARWPSGGRCPGTPCRCPPSGCGIESRPSLRVMSAILRPLPSCPMRFSGGTRTSLKSDHRVRDGPQAHEVGSGARRSPPASRPRPRRR